MKRVMLRRRPCEKRAFFIARYGEQKAFELAVLARKEFVMDLKGGGARAFRLRR